MADPHEGLDAQGFITTGARRANVQPPFVAVVDDAVAVCAGVDGFHSLYAYGSVTTGEARPVTSDLDLLLVVTGEVDRDEVAAVQDGLTHRHAGVVREVGVAAATLAEITAGDDDGHAWRCFVKHYCVCLAGTDLAAGLARCRPTHALLRGLTADTRPVLAGARRAAADPDADVGRVAQRTARKLLLTCAAIASARSGDWTTDRRRGAAWVAARHPEQRAAVEQALDWADPAQVPTVGASTFAAFCDGFGAWVLDALDTLDRVEGSWRPSIG